MASLLIVVAVTAFLTGAAVTVFAMLVIGIRKADRPHGRPGGHSTPLDAVTRSALAAGTWPNGPALGDNDTE
jgi:hypothetical protein